MICKSYQQPPGLDGLYDDWIVTHRYPGGFVIYSDSYRERVCRRLDLVNFLGQCRSIDFVININDDGNALGWNIRQIFGYSSRCTRYLNPAIVDGEGWRDDIYFVNTALE